MVVNVSGMDFIIDDDSYQLFNSYVWHVSYSRYKGVPYLRGTKYRKIWFHRLVLGIVDSKINVDHKNRNTLDNRRVNLRICPRGMYNAINRTKQLNNTSSYKGVFLRKDTTIVRYRAQIRYKQKLVHLGQHEDPKYAASMYDYAAKILFGEFAYINDSGVHISESDKLYINDRIKGLTHEYVFVPKKNNLDKQK